MVYPSASALKAGWAAFSDEGARASSGEYILFLSDSAMVSPGSVGLFQPSWVQSLKKNAEKDNSVVFGPKILDSKGKIPISTDIHLQAISTVLESCSI